MSPNQAMMILAILILLGMGYAIKKEMDKWHGR